MRIALTTFHPASGRVVLAAAVAALACAATAAAATTVGSIVLRSDGGDDVVTAFVPVAGVAHNLFLYDSGAGGWFIRTAPDTVIHSDRSTCGGVLPLYELQEHRCTWAIEIDLGDRDDVLVSNATTTRSPSRPGLVVSGGSGDDRITTSSLPDTLAGDGGDDVILAGNGNDTISGGAGNDTIIGLGGADHIDGGDGAGDLANYPGTEGVVVTLNDDLANDGRANERDRLRNVESVGGSQAGDVITGNAVSNDLNGHRGNDRLYGLGGLDTLFGFYGTDVLDGGSGPDWLDGGDGGDVLLGGSGNDTLLGGPGNDQLTGGTGSDRLRGHGGDDRIDARDLDADDVTCGDGYDTVLATRLDSVDAVSCESVQWT